MIWDHTILRALNALRLFSKMLEKEDMKNNFHTVPVRTAQREELLMIHSPEYIDLLESTEGKDTTYLDPDTQTSPGSYRAALLAAGGLCMAISMVNSGQLDNAFALVRPPGITLKGPGQWVFVFFNNIGIGGRICAKSPWLKSHIDCGLGLTFTTETAHNTHL